jgi:hypothetical protein
MARADAPPAAAADQWWTVDLHRHSVFSADAREDLGILARNAQVAGYNAVFVTDHDRMSSFTIEGVNGHHLEFRDDISRFIHKTFGSVSASTTELASSPVHSGTRSLHLAASSASSGETFQAAKRGPNFRSGAIVLDFWVYPVRIDPGSGAYVSVSIGGDPTYLRPFGYTTSAGVVSPGKSTVLAWQLGQARTDSTLPNRLVITSSLPYTLGTWNHYTIDVTTGAATWNGQPVAGGRGLDDVPAADQPQDYDALTYVKMAAHGNGGTADAYFDDFLLRDSKSECPAGEFVYRNGLIDAYDTSTFKLFPSREMGQQKHTQQWNFGITRPAQFEDRVDAAICPTNSRSAPFRFAKYGSKNIPEVQATGYPTQMNHPGVTVTAAEVIKTKAHGADGVEVHGVEDRTAVWDAILGQNHQIIGSAGTDNHELLSPNAPATYLLAPALTLDALMKAYVDGRMYLAPANFSGRIIFNVDPSSTSPYPARYPVLVPSRATSASVHLSITGGLPPGAAVRWVRNSGSGPVVTSEIPGAPSYERTMAIPLTGSFTYVRAEVRDSAGKLMANTQAIFFERGKMSPGVTISSARWHRGRVRVSGSTVRDLRHPLRIQFACGSRGRQQMAHRARPQWGRFRATLRVPRTCRQARRGVVAAAYRGDSRHRPQRVRRHVRRR